MIRKLCAALLAGATAIACPAMAQQGDAATTGSPACELHVWPTQSFEGRRAGALSSLGLIGAAIDGAALAGKVSTIEARMAEFLGPADQIAELERAGLQHALALNGYRVVAETPLPSQDDAKRDPAIEAQRTAMLARLKSGERLSSSTAPCYAELVGTRLLYIKVTLYGTSLKADWTFRTFPATGAASRTVSGSGRNKLENFPPKTDADVEAAKAGLRAAYAADFADFAEKKLARRTIASR